MNRQEIIDMARECEINFDPAGPADRGIDMWYENQYLPSGALEKFAALVAAKEREACAEMCGGMKTVAGTDDVERGFNAAIQRISVAIRARAKS